VKLKKNTPKTVSWRQGPLPQMPLRTSAGTHQGPRLLLLLLLGAESSR
jgi:hypothetical protein